MRVEHLKCYLKGTAPLVMALTISPPGLFLVMVLLSGCTSEVEHEVAPASESVVQQDAIPGRQQSGDYHRVPMGEVAPSFELINQHNQPLSMDDLKGKVVLLTFIYTHCPDICPGTLNKFYGIASQLSDQEREQLAIVAVTLDPERDTVERLMEYGLFFSRGNEGWFFLTGERSRLEKLWQDYEIQYATTPDGGIIHPSMVVLIDRQGVEQVDYHGFATPVDIILADVKKVLAEE
jgi:protein SCO1/2